jgi:hypothetical protein
MVVGFIRGQLRSVQVESIKNEYFLAPFNTGLTRMGA